ncbi:TetR/AcrR family transcriptional regulator [Agromyces aurantiacus]|uniref:TetR/AcrR family transcriptional regulator n=1 Tax=Agromyces aurantiacus TaxID=165814 RepID=A0ABV9R645_9MICO|nr:TetR/AcrR family transcriptional regulator [Agromyces aurantiacus]MBM7503636.1 AcrR family transcriptional regulator [Agromyces aurantiacus]
MPTSRTAQRSPLTRDRVLQTAMDLADRRGLDALTMRALADELGVEAMSLYHHLPNKSAILDGVVEVAFEEIAREVGDSAAAPAPAGWATALRARILGARRVLLRHPWVPVVMESRGSFGPAQARYVDGVVGLMRSGGLSHDLIHHSLHALGSRMYGFVQELGPDDNASTPGPAELEAMSALAPHLAAMLAEVAHVDPDSTLGWCDDQEEFEFGLDLLLEGIERRRRAASAP